MTDENAKRPDDTTGYKTGQISIPKANAEVYAGLKSQILTGICGCMSLKTRNFWARFWALLRWAAVIVGLAMMIYLAVIIASVTKPNCTAGSVVALTTNCTR